MSKIIISILGIVLIVVLGTYLLRSSFRNQSVTVSAGITSPSTQGQSSISIPVTLNDVLQAGYDNAKQEIPANGQYAPPNLYFRVNETGSSDPLYTLLMVVENNSALSTLPTYGNNIVTFNIPGGTGQEGTMPEGRTVVNFIKHSTYFVIMGPNAPKVEHLALILAQKIP